MRSRNSREAPEVNSSGGNHGRSRWQSAEILRYCMAPSARVLSRPLYADYFGGTPVKAACGRAELCPPRIDEDRLDSPKAPKSAINSDMPDEVHSGGDFPKGPTVEARLAA